MVSGAYGELPEDDPIFQEFRQLRNSGESVSEELDRIIQERPGTRVEAYARLQKALELVAPGNIDLVIPILESIQTDFPGTREAIFARSNLIDYEFETEFGPWRAATDQLFAEAGIPALTLLWSGDAEPLAPPAQFSEEEHRGMAAALIVEAGDVHFEEVPAESVMNLVTYLVINYPERFGAVYGAHTISGLLSSVVGVFCC